jgi:DNA polymerase-3 subunit gamma/tau
MPDLLPTDDPPITSAAEPIVASQDYVVVARRYRPQTFEELIGQEHVTRALQAAIASGRVGHAFLFTGARGTGKTSTARILAKALNCVHGPTPRPCNECDICQSISRGDDVDALEIDGASNRGIDEIRELRQNVNIRPSRARFKIYIIDEVHMLTNQAFNALLKTLEEPPAHVKFIFCTTEPEQIPITILSRCQRYDFANVEITAIAERLAQIAHAEHVEAEPEALMLLARRAAGSMRDSQSLLEQLLAFGNKKITVAEVHQLLGTAGTARLAQIAGHLAERDSAAALADLDEAVREGVDVAQLLDQLIGYFRDLMVVVAGCGAQSLLYSAPGDHAALLELGRSQGMATILATMQILDQTLARLRYSMHARVLAELAIVRICSLADLEAVGALIAEMRSGRGDTASRPTAGRPGNSVPPAKHASAPPAAEAHDALKKKHQGIADNRPPVARDEPGPPASNGSMHARPTPTTAPSASLTGEELQQAWEAALSEIGGLLADNARQATIACDTSTKSADGVCLVVATFPPQYNFGKQFCERSANSSCLEEALGQMLGRKVRLLLKTGEAASPPEVETAAPRKQPTRQRLSEKSEHPWVKRAAELFDARVVWMEEPGR